MGDCLGAAGAAGVGLDTGFRLRSSLRDTALTTGEQKRLLLEVLDFRFFKLQMVLLSRFRLKASTVLAPRGAAMDKVIVAGPSKLVRFGSLSSKKAPTVTGPGQRRPKCRLQFVLELERAWP